MDKQFNSTTAHFGAIGVAANRVIEGLSSIPELFANWRRHMAEASCDADIAAAAIIAARIASLEPVTAADFAMKLLVTTGEGVFQPAAQLIGEAKALAAVATSHEPGPCDTPYARSCTVFHHLEDPTDNATRMASILARMLEDALQSDMKEQGQPETYYIPRDQVLDILFAAYHLQADMGAVYGGMNAAAAEVGR